MTTIDEIRFTVFGERCKVSISRNKYAVCRDYFPSPDKLRRLQGYLRWEKIYGRVWTGEPYFSANGYAAYVFYPTE